MHKEIIILVGNIGEGKSTLTKKYQKEGYVVISRDMLRYAIGGGEYTFINEYEPIIHQTAMFMLNSFLEFGDSIIVDETNLSKILRKKWIEEAKKYDYKIICVELPKLSKEESVQRRLKTPHGQPDKELWESVWDMFDSLYEEPEYSEGFDEIIKLGSKNSEVFVTEESLVCQHCGGSGIIDQTNKPLHAIKISDKENVWNPYIECEKCNGTGIYKRKINTLIATQPNGQRIAFNIDQENK